MPGLMVKDRSLVRLGRALVISTEECRARCCGDSTIRFRKARPCAWCRDPEGEAIYVATSVRCEDGTLPGVIVVDYRCFQIQYPTQYRLCKPGEPPPGPGDDPCVPEGAQVIGPGAEVECTPLGCADPRCGPRYWPGVPCRDDYNGPRVFIECLEGCGYANYGTDCFKFGGMPPLGFLPPGSEVLPGINPLIRDCCHCQGGCSPEEGFRNHLILRPECSTPQYVSCCCPDLSRGCVTVYFRTTQTDFDPDIPQNSGNITVQYSFTACHQADGTLSPSTYIRTTRYTGFDHPPVTFEEEFQTYGPACMAIPAFGGTWPWGPGQACPTDPGVVSLSASSSQSCAAMSASGTVMFDNGFGRTSTRTITTYERTFGGEFGPCGRRGPCGSIGFPDVPIDDDGHSRLGRGFVERPSGLVVPDGAVRKAGGCSGCGGGGGI